MNESAIDERYRLMLLQHYLSDAQESRNHDGKPKWQFICPFCGPLGRTEGKKRQRKAALLWNAVQNSWVFYCSKTGSLDCMNGKTFSNLISALNPALGEAYRRDRWHSGTVGKGHNCKVPQSVVGIGTTSVAGVFRSRK